MELVLAWVPVRGHISLRRAEDDQYLVAIAHALPDGILARYMSAQGARSTGNSWLRDNRCRLLVDGTELMKQSSISILHKGKTCEFDGKV